MAFLFYLNYGHNHVPVQILAAFVDGILGNDIKQK